MSSPLTELEGTGYIVYVVLIRIGRLTVQIESDRDTYRSGTNPTTCAYGHQMPQRLLLLLLLRPPSLPPGVRLVI